jgi:predicted Zn-dependent peptidase
MISSLLLVHSLVSSTAAPPSIPYERVELKNGVEVLLHEDHRVPLVAVDVWVHVGSGDEVPGKSGFAHLFEHMMFQGAKHIGEDVHFDVLREAGATSINGTTNSDRTNYFEVVPSNQLETALWLESDRLGFLLDLLNEKSLQNQRDVVRNERRQRYDNVPYGKERFALAAALYPEGHPYRYLTIGKHEDIDGAAIDDVKAFFTKWYAAKNVTIAIGGDFDRKQTIALLEKWFGGLPAGSAPAHNAPKLPQLAKSERVEVQDPFARLTRIHYAWHSPARLTPDDNAMGVLSDILGATGWGRLYRRLVVDEPLAQDVGVSQWGKGFSGQFDIVVTLKPGSDPARVEAIVKEELLKLAAEPPSLEEVKRSIVATETSTIFGLDELLARVEMLQSFRHYTNDPAGLDAYLADIRAMTPNRVWMTSRKVLLKPRVVVVTTPGGAQ